MKKLFVLLWATLLSFGLLSIVYLISASIVNEIVGKNSLHERLNKSIIARYGKDSRLMKGDDEISQTIIDRYCLAESKDDEDHKPDPEDYYKSGWRPWLCGPMPPTYAMSQNSDGTYHIRYYPDNLNEDGTPKDKWNHKGVKNIELDEFIKGIKK